MNFAIVRFTNDEDAGRPSIVPTNWLTYDDRCYWPPASLNDPKAIIKRRLPSKTWDTYRVKLLRKFGM